MDLRTRLDKFLNRNPDIAADAFVHPDATVIGDVKLASKSSVWPRAVLRGDIERIVVGEGSNIQDGSVVHLADVHAAFFSLCALFYSRIFLPQPHSSIHCSD